MVLSHALDQLHLQRLMGDTYGIELMTFIASFACDIKTLAKK
jgi:hypothetical protein